MLVLNSISTNAKWILSLQHPYTEAILTRVCYIPETPTSYRIMTRFTPANTHDKLVPHTMRVPHALCVHGVDAIY